YLKFIKQELVEGLDKVPKKDLGNLIICYEPVWAISSNKGAKADTPKNFTETSIYIRRVLFFKFGRKIAHEIPIIYGGSVDDENAKGFLEEGGAQGLLVGRASLKAKSFIELLKSVK
ncbi:triose-phosphate isomerase, partial [Patescibacteria group bacterium]